jgi:DNA-binding CsgD family transcriptional regulator
VESIRGYMGKAKKVKLTAVKIAEPLTVTNGLYQGKLAYQWGKQPKVLSFTVRKIFKKIGSRRVEVWKLFF